VSAYEVAVVGDTGETCFTATVTLAPWTARDAQELATDISRCLKPGHTVTAVSATRNEGVARS
jgi:hypothetical protein